MTRLTRYTAISYGVFEPISKGHIGIPISRPGIPFCHFGIPISRPGVPFCHFGVPIDRTGIPFCHFGIPISRPGIPFCHFGIPISRSGVPISPSRIPIGRAGIPVRPFQIATVFRNLGRSRRILENYVRARRNANPKCRYALPGYRAGHAGLGIRTSFVFTYLRVTLYVLHVAKQRRAEFDLRYLPDYWYRAAQAAVYLYSS